MIELPVVIDVRSESLADIAHELRLIRQIAAHQAGWPPAPNPVGTATIQSGEETDMGIEVHLKNPSIDDQGFEQKDKDEIAGGRWIPYFNDEPQTPVDQAKEATQSTIVVPEDTSVYADFVWVDNSGNVSQNALRTPTVLASDVTPPLDPTGEVTAEVGGEVL